MSFAAVAIGVGTVAAGAISADAAKQAGKAQERATNASLDAQGRSLAQQQQAFRPYSQAGGFGLQNLLSGLGQGRVDYTSNDKAELAKIKARLQETVGVIPVGPFGIGADKSAAVNAERAKLKQQYQALVEKRDTSNIPITTEQGSLNKEFGMEDFQADPGYQFRMAEGQKALERSAAARGGLGGGATLKALANYGQNFASNEYQNAHTRFTDGQTRRFNNLMGLANMGQNSAAMTGQAGQNYANQASNLYTNNANAQGAAAIAQANSMNNLIGQGMQAGAMYYGRK